MYFLGNLLMRIEHDFKKELKMIRRFHTYERTKKNNYLKVSLFIVLSWIHKWNEEMKIFIYFQHISDKIQVK